MVQWMLTIWSPVPLPFLKPAWTSGSSQFIYCWSLALRSLSITLLACEVSAIVWQFENSLALPFFRIGMKTDLFQSCGHCWRVNLHKESKRHIYIYLNNDRNKRWDKKMENYTRLMDLKKQYSANNYTNWSNLQVASVSIPAVTEWNLNHYQVTNCVLHRTRRNKFTVWILSQ